MPPETRRCRPALGLAAILILLGTTIGVVVLHELMRLPDAPSLRPQPYTAAPLSRKLVFVIADALRYDYATDPQRAPNLARHMRDDTHAELWAGRITMTSSSILAIGTGQRGDFAEVLTNLQAGRTRFDDFVNSARRVGLRTGLVGDVVWTQLYDHFDPEVHDDAAMAIDVDDSPQMFAAARTILRSDRVPELLVLHFIATDHQGHAYGMASRRYTEFLRRFDADMQALLDELPQDTTLMFMSDHGATDTGAHGSDIPVARRSPFFAYGPGIRKGVALGAIDQVDLGPTVSAILGVASPVHARGTVLTEMLDIPAEQASKLACDDAARAAALAGASGVREAAERAEELRGACARTDLSAAAKVAQARETVRGLDQALEEAKSQRGSRGALVVTAALALLLFSLALLIRRMRPLKALGSASFAALAMGVCLAAVALTFHVERLAPPWHNVVRFVLFLASGLALLTGLLRPQLGVRCYARYPALCWVLLPGALAWSYTANTQVMSLAVLVVAALVVALASDAECRAGGLAGRIRPGDAWDHAALAIALICLVPFGLKDSEPLPSWLSSHPSALVAVCLAAMAAWLAYVSHKTAGTLFWHTALAFGIAAGSLGLRRLAPSWLGLGSLLVLPLLCGFMWLRGARILAIGAGLGAWLWVSRDQEVPAVLACVAAAEILGRFLAERREPSGARRLDGFTSSPWMAAVAVSILFCLSFLMRVGLQGGLDFTSMDMGAGSFGDPNASPVRILLSVVWKYLAAELLLVLVFLQRATTRDRGAMLVAFSSVSAIRAVTIALMLFACRTSYWTALRTLSDAGPAMASMVAGALLLAAWGANLFRQQAREPAGHGRTANEPTKATKPAARVVAC